MKTLFLTAVIAALVSGSAFATPAHAKKPVKAVKTATLVCPITGETIASVKDAAGHSTYNGKTYYFCCSSCKPMFDKNPAKYIHPAAAKK